MHLILIGFMGSGKSSLARQLASRYRLSCYDTDLIIEEETGTSIEDIFSVRGEEWFRTRESEVLLHLSEEAVIATGGGIIERAENRSFLKRNDNIVIWLHPPFEVIYERISNSGRPKVKDLGRQAIYALWKRRLPFYEECKDLIYDSKSSNHAILYEGIDKLLKLTD